MSSSFRIPILFLLFLSSIYCKIQYLRLKEVPTVEEYYSSVNFSATNEELKQQLHDLINPHIVYDYDTIWEAFKDVDRNLLDYPCNPENDVCLSAFLPRSSLMSSLLPSFSCSLFFRLIFPMCIVHIVGILKSYQPVVENVEIIKKRVIAITANIFGQKVGLVDLIMVQIVKQIFLSYGHPTGM
jgi:hypothetical protein